MKKMMLLSFAILSTVAMLASCGQSESSATSQKPSNGTTGSAAETTSGSTGENSGLIPGGNAWSGEIKISGSGTNETFWLAEANKWKEAYPQYKDVTFKYMAIGEDVVDTQVVKWDSAAAPDVYSFAADKLGNLSAAGAIAEVPSKYADVMESGMSEGAFTSAQFNDQTLGYPWTASNGYFMYYSKSALAGVDITDMDAILSKAAELGQKVAYPIGSTAFYSAGALTTYGASWSVSYDDAGAVKDIKADFDGDNGFKAGKAIMNIMNNPAWQDTQVAPTAANKVVATINGPWALNAAEDGTASQYVSDDIGMAILPQVTVNGEKAWLKSFLGTKEIGVNPQGSKGDNDKLAALHSLAYFLASEQGQKDRFEFDASAPTWTELAADPTIAANEAVKTLAAQAAHSVVQAVLPPAIWSAPQTFTAAIQNGTVKDDATLKDALKVMNDTIINTKQA